ncbi:MAG: ATP-binding protein [Rhodanobacteraceae bacterium]
MQSSSLSTRFDPRALVTTLAWLRPCMVIGEALMLLVAVRGLHIALPVAPLLIGLCVAGLTAPATFWRLSRPWQVAQPEAVAQVVFDLLALTWLLYFSGGAANPFITLLLVPIALAAAALSFRPIAVVTMIAASMYLLLMFRHVPLPGMAMHDDVEFRMHLAGMAINFAVSALLLAVFIGRLNASLRRQRDTMQRLRERALRDEGILAIATQAASAAHELNTPLSSLRVLLAELLRERTDDASLRPELELMSGEVGRCRDILNRMVEFGQAQLTSLPQRTTLGEYVHANAERFRLLRPEMELQIRLDPMHAPHPIEVQPGLAAALLNLLNNAADASAQNRRRGVLLCASVNANGIEITVGDQGPGLGTQYDKPFPTSSKPDGLGLGLTLAQATVERMRGEMSISSSGEGARITLHLPINADARLDAR